VIETDTPNYGLYIVFACVNDSSVRVNNDLENGFIGGLKLGRTEARTVRSFRTDSRRAQKQPFIATVRWKDNDTAR
jgi:hypothetical protein